MTIPFLSYFRRNKGNGNGAVKEAPAKPAMAPLDKPSSDRFSKTVMPNSTRVLPPQDPFEMAARSTALGGQMPAVSATGVSPSSPPRPISFPVAPGGPRDLPPAIALALEPQVERVVSLELGDVLTEMPDGYVKPLESIDTSRRVLLKASEVEKGMATGKPSVSMASVYQQMPEIFIRKIDGADTSQLNLPFQKVLEGFANMSVRTDQERASAVPQVETPFLRVTLEDNEKFGTTIEPLETGDLPPVRVQPPTAEAFAAAMPEVAADAQLKMAPTPFGNGNGNGNGHGIGNGNGHGNSQTQSKRAPFKLSPNGTDVPAPESVPASSGPSVPNFLPSPLAPVVARINDPGSDDALLNWPGSTIPATTPAPVRIPFTKAPPASDEEAKPPPEPWLTKESLAAAEETPATPAMVSETARVTEVKIALPLLPILKNLPPMQLTGDPGCVPSDVRIEFPFALVEPQLASGRINVSAKVFEARLPVSFRGLFQAGPGAVDIALPLQEVLKNLPATSLRMRDDQEEQDAGQNFATPFSAKAEEDAKRFNVPATPVAKPMVPEPVEVPEPFAMEPVVEPSMPEPAEAAEPSVPDTAPIAEENGSDRPLRTPLQVALDTDERLDAKGVVALVNKIPGVKACAIMFGDGLSLAGSLPAELDTDGLCAMAPSLMQRVENHLVETKLGQLRGMTLSCLKGAVTFYMHENLCLAALHSDLDLPGETREKLSRIVHELSRKYSHPV